MATLSVTWHGTHGGVELDKLEVLVLEAGAGDHGRAVAGARVRRGGGEVRATITARGQHRVLAVEAMQGAVLHAEREHADALAIVHDEVQRKVLDEVRRVVAQRLRVDVR
jgi:hypothetical protein